MGPFGDTGGYVQLIPGTYKLDKPNNTTGIDEIHLKCDCINGSIVKSIREPFIYTFALDQPPGLKVYKEPRVINFEKINKYVLSYNTFYLEHDVQDPVDFNRETIGFICQIIKI